MASRNAGKNANPKSLNSISTTPITEHRRENALDRMDDFTESPDSISGSSSIPESAIDDDDFLNSLRKEAEYSPAKSKPKSPSAIFALSGETLDADAEGHKKLELAYSSSLKTFQSVPLQHDEEVTIQQGNDTAQSPSLSSSTEDPHYFPVSAQVFHNIDYDMMKATGVIDPISHEYPNVGKLRLPKDCCLSDGESLIDLVLCYEPKSYPKNATRNKLYRQKFEAKLEALGLVLETEPIENSQDGKTAFVKLHAPFEFLARTAEMIGVRKPIERTDYPKQFSLTTKLMNICACCGGDKCFRREAEKDRPVTDMYYMKFERDMQHLFLGIDDKETFFSQRQRIRIVDYVVQRLTVGKLRRKWRSADANDSDSDDEEGATDNVSYQWLKSNGIYSCELPLHDCDLNDPHIKEIPEEQRPLRYWLLEHWGSFRCLFKYQPLDQIRNYFGAEISFYFAWLGFYTKWLTVPALLGVLSLLAGIYNVKEADSVHLFCSQEAETVLLCRTCPSGTCPFTFMSTHCSRARFTAAFDNHTTYAFAVLISIWAVLFMEFWKRHQIALSSRWGMSLTDAEEEVLRPQFQLNVSTTRVSPVTKEEEPYLRKRERIRRLITSLLTIGVMVLVVIALLTAVIVYRTVIGSVIQRSDVDVLKKVDASLFTSVTAALANLMIIQFMSFVYPKVARKMTEYEFPRTEREFENSYTYKVACFQFFNFYGALFYLAFLRGKFAASPKEMSEFTGSCPPDGCFADITIQLIIIMTAKQIFQNILEMGIPKVKIFLRNMKVKSATEENPFDRWEQDHLLEPVSQPVAFGDYLEMVIQYGFITMFAPAFPVAAFFALLNNIFEIRVDAVKYLTEARRTVPTPTSDLGPWQDILNTITRISVVVNAFLIAFTSQTLESIAYRAFNADSKNLFEYQFSRFRLSDYEKHLARPLSLVAYFNQTNTTVPEECWFKGMFMGPEDNYAIKPAYYHLLLVKLAFVVVFEHAIFLIQSLLETVVSDVPKIVRDRHLREEYLVKRKFMQQEFGKNYDKEMEPSGSEYEETGDNRNGSAMHEFAITIDPEPSKLEKPPDPETRTPRKKKFQFLRGNAAAEPDSGTDKPDSAPRKRLGIFKSKNSRNPETSDNVLPEATDDPKSKNTPKKSRLNPHESRASISVSRSVGSTATGRKRHTDRNRTKRSRQPFFAKVWKRITSCDL